VIELIFDLIITLKKKANYITSIL